MWNECLILIKDQKFNQGTGVLQPEDKNFRGGLGKKATLYTEVDIDFEDVYSKKGE